MPGNRISQFSPLNDAWDRKVKDLKNKPKNEIVAETPGGVKLQASMLWQLVDDTHPPQTTHSSITEAYLERLCEFANSKTGITKRMFAYQSCGFYLSISKGRPRGLQIGSNLLKRSRVGGKDLLKVKYLFIEVHRQVQPDAPYRHASLVVISGIHKTIDYYDSIAHNQRQRCIPVFVDIIRFLNHELGDSFIPGEWRLRYGTSPLQQNAVDCAIFVCTNAMSVLFNWPVSYNESNIGNKRRRIAAELLNGGFDSKDGEPLNYPFPMPYPVIEFGHGFQPIPSSCLVGVPFAVRSRRGKYRHVTSKRLMYDIAKNLPGVGKEPKLRGWTRWRKLALGQFIMKVELREEELRRPQPLPEPLPAPTVDLTQDPIVLDDSDDGAGKGGDGKRKDGKGRDGNRKDGSRDKVIITID